MNQPGYLGAIPLDHALAGRFAFHINMPEAKEINKRLNTRLAVFLARDITLMCDAFVKHGAGLDPEGTWGLGNVRGRRG